VAVGQGIDAPAGFDHGIAVMAAVELADVEGDLIADFAVVVPRVGADVAGVEAAAEVGGGDAGDGGGEVTGPAVVFGHGELVRGLGDDEVRAVDVLGEGNRADADAGAAARGGRTIGGEDIERLGSRRTTGEQEQG